jgi:hypothetical protein
VEELPSPNVHSHAVGEFEDVSVNCTTRGVVPEVLSAVNEVTGAEIFVTVMYFAMDVVLLPAELVAVKTTVYEPPSSYSLTGFCSVEVSPLPNDQYHDVGVFVDVSVNWTTSGSDPDVTLASNEEIGSVTSTVIRSSSVAVELPPLLVAVIVTV